MGNYSQADLDAFRDKLAADTNQDYVRPPTPPAAPPPVAPPAQLGVLDRTEQSARRLAANPAIQTIGSGLALAGGLPLGAAYLASPGMNSAPRDTTSFTRENPQPDVVQLKPMAPLSLDVPTVPTLAQQRGVASPGMGGGGGMGDYGIGALSRAYRQSLLNQQGTFNEEKDLVERKGELQGEKIDKMAGLTELEAAQKQRRAELEEQHQAQVAQQHDAFLARNEELANQIASEKIDPNRLMASKSAGDKAMWLISGILNGAAGKGDQVLKRIDDQITEDIRQQQAAVDNKKASLSARQNLFGQMMQESGDRRVAEMQTRNLMLESYKTALAARADRLGIPEVAVNAQLAMNGITQQKQNPLQSQMAKDALASAQAQASANAAAQHAAEMQAWNRSMEVAKLGLEKQKVDNETLKTQAEARKSTDPLEVERLKAQQEVNALNKSISAADPAKVAAGTSLGEAAAEHLPDFIPGVTSARKNMNEREAYNALVRPGVGAAWKLRTGGVEPKNPTILDEQAKAFKINPGDSQETVEDKMARFRRHISESGGSAGAETPALPGSLKFSGPSKE